MRERTSTVVFGLWMSFAGFAGGCAGNPVAPFDSFKNAPMTAFRLQNYEPPPVAVAAPTAPGVLAAVEIVQRLLAAVAIAARRGEALV